jgi:arsenite-transporting ATPase
MLDDLLAQPTRFLFFTGKGGVGKTSISSAAAVALADSGKSVLLVSTDPASNLSEVLATTVTATPTPVAGTRSLAAMDIDPMAAAAAYRERVVGPYRGVLPDEVVAGIEEQLSGSCTVEIAAFDQFTDLLADPRDYDHIIFDTAPTGHTLRMLALPGAWTGYLDSNQVGTTCIGPLSGLTQQQQQYRRALDTLTDPAATTMVIVSRPERGSLNEAARAAAELKELGVRHQLLVVNGVYPSAGSGDPLAAALTARQNLALIEADESIATLPRSVVPLRATPPLGVAGLRALLAQAPTTSGTSALDLPAFESTWQLSALVDEMAQQGHGLVMTVGKGGVGKTTIAAALALSLASRGTPVTVSTTDPAAHLLETLGGAETPPPTLLVERVDPAAATQAYREEVMSTAGANMDSDARAVLAEDLRSPCTEEIAVFRAFATIVAQAESRVVVLDTAPSGHTLLLLDAARSYHRELSRQASGAPLDVEHLLERLQDPEFTRLLVICLAEATPVHEAAQLQDDLLRAAIKPLAWVVNQSLLAAGPSDPLLRSLARNESRWIAEAEQLSDSVAVIPWLAQPPVGAHGLRRLLEEASAPMIAAL